MWWQKCKYRPCQEVIYVMFTKKGAPHSVSQVCYSWGMRRQDPRGGANFCLSWGVRPGEIPLQFPIDFKVRLQQVFSHEIFERQCTLTNCTVEFRLMNHSVVRNDRHLKRLLKRVILDNERNRRQFVSLSDIDEWIKTLCVEVDSGLGQEYRENSNSLISVAALNSNLPSATCTDNSQQLCSSSDGLAVNSKPLEYKSSSRLHDPEIAIGINRMLALLTTVSRPFCIVDGESTVSLSENQNLLLNHMIGKPELHTALLALNKVICDSPCSIQKHMMWLLVNISISLPGAQFVSDSLLPKFSRLKQINTETVGHFTQRFTFVTLFRRAKEC